VLSRKYMTSLSYADYAFKISIAKCIFSGLLLQGVRILYLILALENYKENKD